ncbi:leucine rich adaptor protein 1-like [Boleophthalmus pectinirostris]|uniref:leucine rich adaptor protein 1-like n=1 Tax=Boleophthalmus pectinirostris TaxID=150288 RepID=UPI00242EEDCD|nr:leucine rich adaptor protein 1-like [Boleophthalmus pectinirostris]
MKRALTVPAFSRRAALRFMVVPEKTMAEEFPNNSLPDLKELENKVGRKTPESLLMWLKEDAADTCVGTWSGDVHKNNQLFNDDMSTKISNLKQEMRWLRSTDVRILRQLLVVHEGIEAMRWLVEERGGSVSQSSSLTGSLSSLITVDELGLSRSRYRDSLTSPQDLTEDTEEELNHEPLHTADVSGNLSQDYRPERHSSIFSAHKLEVSPSTKFGQDSQQHSDQVDPNPVRSALLRSSRISRREEKPSYSLSKDENVHPKVEIELKDFENKHTIRDMTAQEEGIVMLGYDAQWCWVESQDDVTFL